MNCEYIAFLIRFLYFKFCMENKNGGQSRRLPTIHDSMKLLVYKHLCTMVIADKFSTDFFLKLDIR